MASNKILNMIFKADDKASATIDQISGAEGKGGIGGITASLKGMINPAVMATAGIAALGLAVQQSIADWREHTMAVADLTAMFDTTAESASVLTQLMKDFDISADSMSGTMSALARNGFGPSVEGLIAVREELNTAANATERLMMAQTLMGEQGVKEFLPMLDQLSDDQLRNYIDTMEEGNIVTEEQIEVSREMELALSGLDDQWKSFTRGLMTDTVPVLNDVLFIMGSIRDEGRDSSDWWKAFAFPKWELGLEGLRMFGEAMGEWRERIEDAEDPMSDHIGMVGEVAMIHEAARLALEKEGVSLEGLSIKELEHLAVQHVIAGDFTMADAIMKRIRLHETEADRIQGIIDLLYELDGTSIYYSIEGAWSGGPGAGPGVTPRPGAGGGGSDMPEAGFPTWDAAIAAGFVWKNGQWVKKPDGYQHGGEFIIGGMGGPDSQLVQFMGTPGEPVTVGEGNDNVKALVAEVRRLTNALPIIMRDVMERA